MPNVSVSPIQTINVKINQGTPKTILSTPQSPSVVVRANQTTNQQAVRSTTQFIGVDSKLKAEIDAAYALMQQTSDMANNIMIIANNLELKSTVDTFYADGHNMIFDLSVSPPNANSVFVNLNGVTQLKQSFSLSNNIIQFSEAPEYGAVIEITTLSFGTN